jgi:hypothetical protein
MQDNARPYAAKITLEELKERGYPVLATAAVFTRFEPN